MDADVAVIGAGVVGSAVALALARSGVSVALCEAEAEPGLAASGTNSGVLHTGFDSKPGELETELILRAAQLRDPVLEALGVPVMRCGAVLRPREDAEREAVERIARNAERNGVEVVLRGDGSLEVPGEAVTDPVAFTLALAAAAQAHGARLRTDFRVIAIEDRGGQLVLRTEGGAGVAARCAVNCAGLGAGEIAREVGERSLDVYPRKGEFLVFEPGPGGALDRILLPVPEAGTKGVLVFPTLDGKVVAGPTAHDQEDPTDWSVRQEAREEIMPKAVAMHPPLDGAEPIAGYAGLRPAGRGSNYVIRASETCSRLVHAAAIRSTGLTASLAIAERVRGLVAEAGIELAEQETLRPGEVMPAPGSWWRRAALYRGERASSASAGVSA